jgi:hypothetical protein
MHVLHSPLVSSLANKCIVTHATQAKNSEIDLQSTTISIKPEATVTQTFEN